MTAAEQYKAVAWIRSFYLSGQANRKWAVRHLRKVGQTRAEAERVVAVWDKAKGEA